jgi:hypothetical protein
MASITSANSVYMLAINGLYTVPQQLQGYAADDAFATEAIETSEVTMGVDGILSAGFIFVPIKQDITLQADSASNTLFEAWYTAEQAAREKYFANAIINLPSLNRSYVLTNGVLSTYTPISDAKKVMQPRKFGITWNTVIGAPL